MRRPDRLSAAAREAIERSNDLRVSAASVYEMALKATFGKWPDLDDLMPEPLCDQVIEAGSRITAVTGVVMESVGRADSSYRDPYDRIIAASAAHYGMPLIFIDAAMDTAPWNVTRIWWRFTAPPRSPRPRPGIRAG